MMMATEYYILASYSSQNHTNEYLAFIWRRWPPTGGAQMATFTLRQGAHFVQEDFKTFHYKNIAKINLPFIVVLYQLTLLEYIYTIYCI